MKKELTEKIEIPEGIEAEIEKDRIKLKKEGRELSKKYYGFEVKKENNDVILYCKKATKREKKMMKTLKAHIKNIISGLQNKFLYKLQICSVHFPISVSINNEKKEVLIKNFLGEAKPRTAKILDNVEVNLEKEIISVESSDVAAAGQTAANIESATRISKRDRRIFQDGIFITQKGK